MICLIVHLLGSLAKKATNLSIPVASLKFPPIAALSYSSTRAKDWDDILTAHTDESFTRSWSMKDKRLGNHTFGFVAEGKKGTAPVGSARVRVFIMNCLPYSHHCIAQAVCVTACGNFGIVSSSTGAIRMYNMQSGIYRKTFDIGPCPARVPNRSSTSRRKAERCVTGLASDALDRTVIASTLDGTVNVCHFCSYSCTC